MEKQPEETLIVALENELIDLKLSFPDDPPVGDVTFLLNGNTEHVGHKIGFRPEQHPTTSFSTTIEVPSTGEHVAHGIWAPDGETDLSEFETLQEIDNDPGYANMEWKIHGVSESDTLDDIRTLIDDLTRAGTLVYGGKKLIEKIRNRYGESLPEDEKEAEEEDYFQESISNY